MTESSEHCVEIYPQVHQSQIHLPNLANTRIRLSTSSSVQDSMTESSEHCVKICPQVHQSQIHLPSLANTRIRLSTSSLAQDSMAESSEQCAKMCPQVHQFRIQLQSLLNIRIWIFCKITSHWLLKVLGSADKRWHSHVETIGKYLPYWTDGKEGSEGTRHRRWSRMISDFGKLYHPPKCGKIVFSFLLNIDKFSETVF